MPGRQHLDPRAQAACEYIRVHPKDLAGAILPRLFPAALPSRSTKRGYCDFVALAVLAIIISAYRLNRNGNVYFDGPLYQLIRRDLARELGVHPDDISTALTWLRGLGLIGYVSRPLFDKEGQPDGKETFVWPIMARIQEFIDEYKRTGRTPRPFTVAQARARLAARKKQVDPDKDHGSLPESGGDILNGDLTTLNNNGGGEADAEAEMHLHEANAGAAREKQLSPPSKPGSKTDHGQPAAPPTWSVPPSPRSLSVETDLQKAAWRKGSIFCALWQEAITRLGPGHLAICVPNVADHKAAFNFFLEHPESDVFRILATAITAWSVADQPPAEDGEFDEILHCRISIELRAFLRSFKSGKLRCQIHRQGLTINAWDDSRLCLTQSEMIYYGWPADRVPVRALTVIWENELGAPAYYRRRIRALPPEVLAAEKLRELAQNLPK